MSMKTGTVSQGIFSRRICLAMAMLFTAGWLFAAGQRPYGTFTMAAIPKQRSSWFDDYEKGIIRGGQDFGVEVYTQAPSNTTQQVRLIEDAIGQGVTALLVVPNDASFCAPAFSRARQQNIAVITHESPNQSGADFNIEMIDYVRFGESFMDELVQVIGPTGEFAIFVGSLTVPSHKIWADAAIAYQKRNYPGLTLVADRFPVSEDKDAAYQKTLELLSAYPNLQGIISFGSQGAPGAGQAIRENPRQKRFAIFGTTPPNEISPFLKDRTVTKSILWRPGDAAYAMTYVAKMILDGRRSEIRQGFTIPGLGEPRFDGMNILFDNPLVVTAANVDNFDF